MNDETRLLRWTLKANGSFSLASATLILGFSHSIAAWMGIPDPLWVWALGPGLLVFGGLVLGLGFRQDPPPGQVRLVTWLDWGWVAGSAGVLALAGNRLTTAGLLTVADVALVVAAFACLQWIGLRRATGRAPA